MELLHGEVIFDNTESMPSTVYVFIGLLVFIFLN